MVGSLSTSLAEAFSSKKVLVTGHTGFKGSWLSLWLSELGAEVSGFALAPEYDRSHFELLGLEDHIQHIVGDLRDANQIRAACERTQPEFVFHLAAQALVRRSYTDPKSTFDTNLGGSVNILEEVRRSESVRTLVFITSDKCYLNKEWTWGYRENDELGGHDPYSASKAAAEMAYKAYAHSFFKDSVTAVGSARAGNVIGGGDWAEDRIVPDCVRALEKGEPITLRSPDATRPWQHVLDPLHGYLRLAIALRDGEISSGESWNFGPEISVGSTVLDVAETAVAHWGDGAVLVDNPADRPFEHRLLQLSIDKAKLELGWRPRWDTAQSVGATMEWYRRVLSGEDAYEVSTSQINAYASEASCLTG